MRDSRTKDLESFHTHPRARSGIPGDRQGDHAISWRYKSVVQTAEFVGFLQIRQVEGLSE